MIPIDEIIDWPNAEHARWGQGTFDALTSIIDAYATTNAPIHPVYQLHARDWEKWRAVYNGGDSFIERFVKKFSRRESTEEFRERKKLTPIAAFSTSAIDEIKNSIFQRIADTTRKEGSTSYQKAINGELGGVNLQGANMNWFIGHCILPDLLVQKKIGVLVDAPNFGVTQSEKGDRHPYLIPYRAEDILNWDYSETGTYTAVYLREFVYSRDETTGLPYGELHRHRHMFINPKTGFVNVVFYNGAGAFSKGPIELQITELPFHCFELTKSLMQNVANHQIALTNMESSDISYILKANYPLYTEQFDPRTNSPLIDSGKAEWANSLAQNQNPPPPFDPNCPTPLPTRPVENMNAGNSDGRRYPAGMDRPEFIAPPSGPIKVSMEKARVLQDNVRTLVHLALASVQSSAESKKMDRQQGLESGLSAIGLELQHGERQIAKFWSNYEGSTPATVLYTKHWSIKSVDEIATELKGWQQLRDTVPSKTFKIEVNKIIVEQVLATRVASDVLDKINGELDKALGGSSDPKTINQSVESGILSAGSASLLMAYNEDEAKLAQAERSERLAAIASAQAAGGALNKEAAKEATAELESPTNPAARGVPELSASPKQDAQLEKAGKAGRGEGK